MAERSSDGTPRGEVSQQGAEGGSRSAARRVPAEIRDVSFHTAVRGYERSEVDRYVKRVNQLIAELEMMRSPDAAVRQALDRVGEHTSGILEQARDTADSILDAARAEADEALARAAAESQELVDRARTDAASIFSEAGKEANERARAAERELAEARERAEDADAQAEDVLAQARSRAEEIVAEAEREAQAIIRERGRVLDEIRGLARRLESMADRAGAVIEEETTVRHIAPVPETDELEQQPAQAG